MTAFDVYCPKVLHNHVLHANKNYGIPGNLYARTIGTLLILIEKIAIVAVNIFISVAYTACALVINLTLLPVNIVASILDIKKIDTSLSIFQGAQQIALSVGDIFAPIVIAVANLINPSYLTPLAVLNPKTPSNDTSLEVNCKIKKHKSANNELQKFIIDLEKTIENHRQTLAQTTDQVEKGEIEKKITEINKSISILEKSIIDRGKKIQNLKKTLLEKV